MPRPPRLMHPFTALNRISSLANNTLTATLSIRPQVTASPRPYTPLGLISARCQSTLLHLSSHLSSWNMNHPPCLPRQHPRPICHSRSLMIFRLQNPRFPTLAVATTPLQILLLGIFGGWMAKRANPYQHSPCPIARSSSVTAGRTVGRVSAFRSSPRDFKLLSCTPTPRSISYRYLPLTKSLRFFLAPLFLVLHILPVTNDDVRDALLHKRGHDGRITFWEGGDTFLQYQCIGTVYFLEFALLTVTANLTTALVPHRA